jgi:excisionase family DNA binding protein
MAQFYSIQEAADYLQVDYKVVYRLVRDGSIPSSRVGWQYRMTQEDLNTYLNVQRARHRADVTGSDERAGHANRNGNGNGAVKAALPGVQKLKARQMEQNGVNRFNQKVREIGTLRHPLTGSLLVVEDWEQIYEKSEDLDGLMVALNTAFLDRVTLATTPRNSRIRYTLGKGADGLVLELRFLAHLSTICKEGADDRPASLEELLVVLDELEQRYETEKSMQIVGLASPTGWSQEATDYIAPSEKGNSYSHSHIGVLLLDLRKETLIYDELNGQVAGFAGLYRLATEQEDVSSLEDKLQFDLIERGGVILADFAARVGVSEELAETAARRLVAIGKYRLIEDAEAGAILVSV